MAHKQILGKLSGGLLLICSMISVIFSNIGGGGGYLAFWGRKLFTSNQLPSTPLHIINEVLMTVFFFAAGLEIRYELTDGIMNNAKRAMMPVIAALGGMAVPILLCFLFCNNAGNFKAIGIPMATDVAFPLAILALLGSRVPASVRLLLTAIAIIDDIGGILVITLGYQQGVVWGWVIGAVLLIAVLQACRIKGLHDPIIYLAGGLLLWYCVYRAGISAPIAGVVLAFCLPGRNTLSIAHRLYLPVNFIILPLFAMANTALLLPAALGTHLSSHVFLGVFWGLVVGKPVGICLASMVAIRLRWAALPAQVGAGHLVSLGILAGVGFTVSLFMAVLAFPEGVYQFDARLAVMCASLVAGLAGYAAFRVLGRRKQAPLVGGA